MKKALLAGVVLLAIPLIAQAEDNEWSGSGEVGFALTTGNTKSQNLNAKLAFKKEDVQWKHNFFLNALRSKGESNGQYDLTANRFDLGASSGYKFDERSYVVGAARYENDDFSPYTYQWILSIGYGYTFIKNAQTELSAEVGPGYRRVDLRAYEVTSGDPPVTTFVDPAADGNIVARGLVSFKHKFNESTSFENTTLIETGSNNSYLQNDAGLAVSMSEKLALKLGYQVRHNSDVNPGKKKTDQLLTTNLVFKF
jgi:putative salt-induced outer membrane protein